MVRAITLGAALALLVIARAGAELNLTPSESFYEVEGIRVPNVTFRNGIRDVPYTPPAGWTLSGGGCKLALTPPDSVQAGATIETEPTREPLPGATSENLKLYSELAVRFVPREASKIELLETIVCPLRISGKTMIEITMAYTFFGQQFRTNVLIMPREKEQLRFQFIARTADYALLHNAFRASLYSIQGL